MDYREPEEVQELKNCYKFIFGTPQGEKVLEDLKYRGYFTMSTFFGEDNSNQVLFKEGHRNFLLYILSQLKEDEEELK